MKLSDEIRIPAPRERVFAALNDPDVLRQAIPGCEALEQTSETELTATVRAKVGPVNAKFQGRVTLSDLNPPESYTISGEGKGGAAGFAKGSARVTLSEDGAETVLRYDVDADVGGKLAQVGSRLIEGTSKKLAGEFFEAFGTIVAGGGETADEAGKVAAAEAAPESLTGIPWWAWIVGSIVLGALIIYLL